MAEEQSEAIEALLNSTRGYVRVLTLQPGDVLVFKIPGLDRFIADRGQVARDRIAEHVRRLLDDAGKPEIKAMTLDATVDLAVVREAPTTIETVDSATPGYVRIPA